MTSPHPRDPRIEEVLRRVAELSAHITPGPWVDVGDPVPPGPTGPRVASLELLEILGPSNAPPGAEWADAAFIAFARTALPLLSRHIAEQAGRVEALERVAEAARDMFACMGNRSDQQPYPTPGYVKWWRVVEQLRGALSDLNNCPGRALRDAIAACEGR